MAEAAVVHGGATTFGRFGQSAGSRERFSTREGRAAREERSEERAKKGPGTASPNHRSGPVTLASDKGILSGEGGVGKRKNQKNQRKNQKNWKKSKKNRRKSKKNQKN